MALVAYDNSDCSDFEDEEDDFKTSVPTVKETASPKVISDGTLPEDGQNLFNQLPKPSHKKPTVIEEDDEFLHKKEKEVVKPKAKISVPSLQDFKDVEDSPQTIKNKFPSGKKSGLLSILPQPKNGVTLTTKSFIPNVLKQKPVATNVTKPKQIQPPLKKVRTETKSLINDYSDESDNEELGNDFFSINKPVVIDPEPLPVDVEITPNTSKTTLKIESYFKQPTDEYASTETDVTMETNLEEPVNICDDTGEPGSSNGDVLDDEAILKLVGARGKRKREEIQIVDVNQKEVLGDSREWLLKGLMDDTSQRMSSSKKKGHEPTNQQKRKHQITYLAHQAKANEAELQNQWANSRMSRRQTQSKYGF